MNRKSMLRALALATLGFAATAVWAEVSVTEAWVRGTVPSQTVTGAFMTLKSAEDAAVIGAESPAAGLVEMHEMRMENDVARMRQIERLALPADQALALRPGGYHLMLIDLKRPLKAGDSIPLTLRIERRDGSVQRVDVEARVRALGAAHAHGSHDKHMDHQH